MTTQQIKTALEIVQNYCDCQMTNIPEVDQAIAALDGKVLVPVEPTEAMLEAICPKHTNSLGSPCIMQQRATNTYRKMIQAGGGE